MRQNHWFRYEIIAISLPWKLKQGGVTKEEQFSNFEWEKIIYCSINIIKSKSRTKSVQKYFWLIKLASPN